MELNYRNEGNILIPDLKVPKKPKYPIGSYGRMRKAYLKNYRPGQYSAMMIQGTLLDHLSEIDNECHEEFQIRVKAMAKAQGITEDLKKADMMKWTRLMNNIQNAVREEIMHEIVYAEDGLG